VKRIVFYASFLLLLNGCGLLGDPEAVKVDVKQNYIVIDNQSNAEICFFTVDSTQKSEVWTPACRAANQIRRGGSQQVSTESMESGTPLQVNWWHKGEKIAGSDLYGADRVRSTVVTVMSNKQKSVNAAGARETTERLFQNPYDAEAVYFISQKTGTPDALTVLIKRDSQQGTQYSRWLFNCVDHSAQNFGVTASVQALENAANSLPSKTQHYQSATRLGAIAEAVCK
jgi:hypothetical protein